MNDREKILVHYALLLGLFGEDSETAQQFAELYQDDRELWPALVEVNLLYRSLKI